MNTVGLIKKPADWNENDLLALVQTNKTIVKTYYYSC